MDMCRDLCRQYVFVFSLPGLLAFSTQLVIPSRGGLPYLDHWLPEASAGAAQAAAAADH